MDTLIADETGSTAKHARDRRDPGHPLRRTNDYRPDGTRTRRWSGPERSVRLSYRRRPLATLAATVLAVLLPATLTVAATSIASDDYKPEAGSSAVSVSGTGRVIAIDGAGYGVAAVTIAIGETVSFMNMDAVPHDVRIEPATGSTCEAAALTVWPGVYRSCTFTGTGTYVISDPSFANASFRTDITVAPATDVLTTVVFALDRTRVVSGRSVALNGAINIPRSGAQVDIVAKDLATGVYRKVGQTRTGASGEFTFTARPARTTAYFANAILNMTVVTSPIQTVEVTPNGK